jgi:hypothetical protein
MSNAKLIEVESLRSQPDATPLFQGQDHGGVRLSVFVVDAEPGEGTFRSGPAPPPTG